MCTYTAIILLLHSWGCGNSNIASKMESPNSESAQLDLTVVSELESFEQSLKLTPGLVSCSTETVFAAG
jgi:hypothetical protein